MYIQLELSGKEATEQVTLNLQDWIRKEQIFGLQVERKNASPKKGEMGLDPLTILTIVLGSKAMVELVKSIHVWMQSRKPKLNIKIKWEGKEFEINAENLPDFQNRLDKLMQDVSHLKD